MKLLLALLLLSSCGSTTSPAKSIDALIADFGVETGNGSLSIPQAGLSDRQLTGLLADPRTPALWTIELSGNAIGKEGLSALLNSEKTRQLKWLNLSDNRLDDAAIQVLANSDRLRTIEHLLLADNTITGAGIQALAASPHLGKLRVLSLGNQAIGDTGAKALAQLSGLESLSLESTGISGRGASALLQKLDANTLTLRNNPLNEGHIDFPAFSDKLKTVDLRQCGLEPQQIQALGRADLGTGLELLHLDENPFGDAGIQALGDATWIGKLKKLTVEGSGASLEVRKGLREFWGKRGGMTIELR
jgi:Ran GTPase-activating protein (RanGAP) involved in mRNA processing and transport